MSGIRYRCRGALAEGAAPTIARLLERGLTAAAEEHDRTQRVACGYDFTEELEAAPADGLEHVFVCPSCSAEHPFRKVPAAALEELATRELEAYDTARELGVLKLLPATPRRSWWERIRAWWRRTWTTWREG